MSQLKIHEENSIMDFNQIIDRFKSEMLSQGITPPHEIIADGQLHRFHIDGDKSRSKNGWYVLYLDGIPCGIYGSWKKGAYLKWCAKNKDQLNSLERSQQIEKIKEACRIRNTLKAQEQHEASSRAEYLWRRYEKASSCHPYIVKKRILPFYARQYGKEIVLPVIDFEGKVWSLQYISESGEKRFLANGAIKSHFIPVQERPADKKKTLICEGFATGATLAKKYPTYCVIAACDAGNLKPVAMHIRKNLPDVEIVICGDDDRLNTENTGANKARSAAIAVGALLSMPKWPEDAPESLKDYNDLACWFDDKGKQHG